MNNGKRTDFTSGTPDLIALVSHISYRTQILKLSRYSNGHK